MTSQVMIPIAFMTAISLAVYPKISDKYVDEAELVVNVYGPDPYTGVCTVFNTTQESGCSMTSSGIQCTVYFPLYNTSAFAYRPGPTGNCHYTLRRATP